MARVQKITTNQTYIDGRFVPKGFPVMVETDDLSGNERNFADAKDIGGPDIVQMAAVAPTGPNPTMPQQVPPDAIQTIEGHVVPGAILTGETTSTEQQKIAEQLLDDSGSSQAAVAEAVAASESKDKAAALLDDSGDPLDHDGDGRKGGSKTGDESTAAKGAAKKA